MVKLHTVLGRCVPLLALSCGETKTLELFPKKAPMKAEMPEPPATDAPCGELPSCPPERAMCLEGSCVECIDAADCSGPKPVCSNHVCVECDSDDRCPPEKVCFEQPGKCTEPCSNTPDCNEKGRPVCAIDLGVCVACVSDADCDAARVCDPVNLVCVGCLSDGNCGDAGTCDPIRRACVP